MITAILLAAGLSTRTKQCNKLLLTYRGKKIIKHAVDNILKSKIDYLIVITGRNKKEITNNIPKKKNIKIIWAPDKHLGGYIKDKTNADMKLWNASCIVHEEFKASSLLKLMKKNKDAAVLVHPESPKNVANKHIWPDCSGVTKKRLMSSGQERGCFLFNL